MAQDLFTQLAQQTLANISTEGPAEVGDDPVSAIYQVAQERGIDPAHLLGLAKLETQAGAKTVKGGGADTRNLFNVKDFSKDGSGIRARDKAEGSNDRYRTYGSYRESVEDLAGLLERRYPGAAKAGSPEEFARELKRGGYATDPAYESKLARVIRSSGGAARPAAPAQEWDQGARYAPVGVTIAGTDKPQPAEKPKKGAGFWEGAADVGLSTAQGVVGSVKALTDLAGADNAASRSLDDASKGLEKSKSEASQADRQYHQQRIKEAEASGDWKDEVAAYANMVWDMPLESLAQGVGSFATLGAGKVAQMAKLASAAKKAGVAKEAFLKTAQGIEAAKKASDLGMKVNVSLGVGQGIGGVKGSQYEQTYNAAKESGLSERQAQTLAAEAQSYQQGWGQQALGAGLGYLAGKTGPIEKLAAGKTVGAGGVARRFVGGGLVEAGTEGLQGGQERYAGNAAAINAGVLDESKRWAGVAGSGASEAITAGVLGGGAGAIGRPDVDPQAQAKAAAQKSGGIVSRAGLAATPGAQQPNPAAPSQPAANPGANPGAAATTVPAGNTAVPAGNAGNAGNTAAASTAPNPYFDGVTDEALANMGQFMTTRQTMTDGTPITEADRQVGRDALAELQRRRLVAKANPQPAQTPTQASALSAIEQALEADKQRRRAAGEVVDDDDVTDVEVKAPVQPGAEKLQLSDERDAMLPQALDLLRQDVRPSVAAIQGKLRIGFNRAARILEEMERDGVVGPMDAQGARQILKLPDPPDAQANTLAQPASAGFSLPAFDNSPIPKMDPAAADEQRRQFAEFEQKRKNRRAGTRSAAWERNPFLAFLGANGLNRDTASEFAPGLTERRKAFVPGYGPVFRPGAKNLDELVQTAKEDGFLRDDDGEPELYDLIDRALRGERIAPLFADGAAEAEGQRRQQEMLEREGATYDDYLQQHSQAIEADDFDPLESIGASGYDFGDSDMDGYAAAPAPLQAEVAALSQHYYDLGFDPDEVLERLSIETENQPEQAYYDLAKSRFTQLIEQALSPGRREGSTEQGGGGAVRRDAGQASAAQADGSAAGGQGQAAAVTPPAAPAVAQPRRTDAIRAKLDDLKSQGFSQFTRSSGRTLLLNPETYETVELTPAEMAVARKASGQARAGLQSLRGQRKPAQVDQQGVDVLQSYTPADVLAQEEQSSQQQAAEQAERDKAQAQARADDERKRIEQASYAAADSFELGQNPLDSLTGQKDIFGAAPVAQGLAGERINDEWTAFDPQSGTLGIPRAEMPQIKAEHRGAMMGFLKARGIDGQQETIPSAAIKPTQAEFSPAKVKKALDREGGNRSIIVSADGYVVDGHHQWLAAREKGEPIQAIRLDQNIGDVLAALKDMPSAQPEQGAMADPVASLFDGKPDPRNSAPLQELDGFQVGEAVDVPSRTIGRSQIEVLFKRTTAGEAVNMARIVNADGKKLDVLTGQLVKVEDKQGNTFKDPKTGQTVVVSTKATADAMANSKQLKGRATVRKATEEELKSGNVSFVGYDEKDPKSRGYVIELDEPGGTYEQRNADRIARAKAADTQEVWDAITAEENADPERDFSGTDALRMAINMRVLDLKPDNGSFAIYPDRQETAKPAEEGSQYPLVEHTTAKGKVLRGFIVRGMTLDEVKASIDPYALKKDGGVFVREQHKDKLPKPAASDKPAETPEPQGGQEKQATQSNANQQGQDDSGAQWSRMTSIDREAVALRAKMPKAAAAMWSKRGWDAIDSVIQEKLEKAMRRAETAIQSTSDAVEVEGMTQAEAQQALEAGQKLLHYDEEIWIDRAKTDAVDSYVIKNRYTDSPVVSTKGPAGPRGVQWGKSEAAKRAVESMGLPQERQPDSATPADDASENVKKLAELKQDLQALQQRIKEQSQVADDRLLERERKLSDVVKSLERDIQKAKLDQIPAASVPDDARNKALEAGKEMANSIFDWTGKSSGVAKVKVAVMDSLMAQGYFDDGVANLAKQIVEELRNGSKSTPSVSLEGKASGDVLVMSNGTLYRIEGIDVARNFIRLVRNPDMLSERIVSMGQDDYDRLLADDEQTRQVALQQSGSQAIQDFIDGKIDRVPTLEEVQADTLDKLEKELADWQVRRELPINQAQTGVIDEEIAKLQAQVDALRGATGQEDELDGEMQGYERKAEAVEAARYLKDFVYSLGELDGMTDRAQVELSSPLGKSGRDTLLMRAFGLTRDEAHDINNRLDSRKPNKLRNVDMQEAFEMFPGLRQMVDEAIGKASGKKPSEPATSTITANPDLDAIFDQLDGITQRTQAAGRQAAAEHPQAERIQFVQKHILDILEDLEDSGKVTINC